MSNTDTIEVSALTLYGERVGVGEYKAKMIACEGKSEPNKTPYVQATYEIQDDGPYKFAEISSRHYLKLMDGKKGKFCFGAAEICQALTFAGSPLPATYRFPMDPDKAANLFAKGMKGKTFRLGVYEEKYLVVNPEDPTGQKIEKTTTKAKVLQTKAAVPVSAPAAAAAVDDDPFGGL